MKKYSIKSQNLNDSLVFYRALFNKMPERLGIDFLEFNTSQFQLEIGEGKSHSHQMLTMKIEKAELLDIHNRMNRFLSKERLKENCEVIEKAIGLIDPDGNQWKIGDPIVGGRPVPKMLCNTLNTIIMEQFKFHVGLNVTDVEQTTNFYQRLFGQEPVKVEKGYSKFELDNPGLVISFIESKSPSPQFGHMGIRVNSKEELAEKKQELEALMKIELEETNTSCCFAVQDKFWVKDPDGYEWEVYHFLKDDDQMGGRQEIADEKKDLVGCC